LKNRVTLLWGWGCRGVHGSEGGGLKTVSSWGISFVRKRRKKECSNEKKKGRGIKKKEEKGGPSRSTREYNSKNGGHTVVSTKGEAKINQKIPVPISTTTGAKTIQKHVTKEKNI